MVLSQVNLPTRGHLASSGDSVFGCQDSGGSEELLLTVL